MDDSLDAALSPFWMEHHPIPSLVMDTQGQILIWNRAMEAMTGIPEFQAKQGKVSTSKLLEAALRVCEHLKTGKLPKPVGRFHFAPFATRPVVQDDFYLEIGLKQRCWIRQQAEPVFQEDGEVVGIIATFADISEWKDLEKEIQQSQKELEENKIQSPSGFFSSSFFEDRLHTETQRSRRYQRPLSMMYIDIDDFKRINIHGDDAVLTTFRHLYEIVSRLIRKMDSAHHLGYDHFAILLPETRAEDAKILAERIRSVFEADSKSQEYPVTFSASVEEYNPATMNAEEFMESAKANCQLAKISGKNRIA